MKLLYSYLDDFLGGAGHFKGSLRDAIDLSAKQISCMQELGRWLGLTFLKSKTVYPNSSQALLGFTLNLLHREVSLKQGKATKVVGKLEDLLTAES